MPTWCNYVIYWSYLSSTCFGRIRPSSEALDVKLKHIVFCIQFVDGWWCRVYGLDGAVWLSRIYKLSAENHMLQLNIYCSWWWAYAPETCRAKETSINYIVASSWHFTLFRVLVGFRWNMGPLTELYLQFSQSVKVKACVLRTTEPRLLATISFPIHHSPNAL